MTNFLIYATTMISIWVVLALSLNIQFGLTGLVNFGQILPFAVGAYVEGIIELSGLPIWTGPIFVLIVSPLIGILVIFPAKQLAQDYWALITLGAGEIFRLIMLNYPAIAGGTEGVSVDRINNRMLAMILAIALAVAVYMISLRISRSPFGRFLRVIREDEVLGACLGRDPFSYQIKAMMISWSMAGLAGALYAHVTGFIHPSGFMVTETLIIWTAVILGGTGPQPWCCVGCGGRSINDGFNPICGPMEWPAVGTCGQSKDCAYRADSGFNGCLSPPRFIAGTKKRL